MCAKSKVRRSELAERGKIIMEGAMSWFDFCLGVLLVRRLRICPNKTVLAGEMLSTYYCKLLW